MLRHTPVMVQEMCDSIKPSYEYIMDGTFGHGGHTQAFLNKFPKVKVVGVDRDDKMIVKAKNFLETEGLLSRADVVQSSYADFDKIISESSVNHFDLIFLDLGVNMDHFKVAERGFSIKLEGDLDMRFDTNAGISLKQRISKTNYEELMKVFALYTNFGQKFLDRITRSFLEFNKRNPFQTTKDVRERARSEGINDKGLAVIFQAFRIVTNDELGELNKFLSSFLAFLSPGGRCCIMTYHSGEDRIVKYSFKELVDNGSGLLYNKKVIKPNWKEIKHNKAARSAKLRIFEKS